MSCSLQIRMLYLSRITIEIVRNDYLILNLLKSVVTVFLPICIHLASFPIQQGRQKLHFFSVITTEKEVIFKA